MSYFLAGDDYEEPARRIRGRGGFNAHQTAEAHVFGAADPSERFAHREAAAPAPEPVERPKFGRGSAHGANSRGGSEAAAALGGDDDAGRFDRPGTASADELRAAAAEAASSSFGRSTTKLDAGGGAAGAFAHADADAGRFDRPSTAPPTQELARPQFGRGSAAAAEAVTEVRGGQGAAEVFSGQHFGDDRFARNDTVGAAAASAQFERPQFARKATKFHDDGNAYDVFGRSLGVDTNADGVENTFDPSENVQVNMGEGAEEPPAPEEPREPTEPRFTRLGVDTTADGEENTYDPSENVHVHMGSGSDEPPAPEEAPEPTQPRFTRKGVDTNADGQANTYVHSAPTSYVILSAC